MKVRFWYICIDNFISCIIIYIWLIIDNVYFLPTNLESFALFIKFIFFWYSIICIIVWQLMNLKKNLEWCFPFFIWGHISTMSLLKLAKFRITHSKVTLLFVSYYPPIFIQAEMKTLITLSLSLFLSLSLSLSLCLLITKLFCYICEIRFIQIVLRFNNH